MASKRVIKTTLRGFTKGAYLTEEQISNILEHVTEGIHPNTACNMEGTSFTQFKGRMNREPEVKERFQAAFSEYTGGARLGKLHAELEHQIYDLKNWQALREQLLIHDPDYEVLRTQRFQVGVTAETLGEAAKDAFAELSDEELEAKIAALEAARHSNVIELPVGEQSESG